MNPQTRRRALLAAALVGAAGAAIVNPPTADAAPTCTPIVVLALDGTTGYGIDPVSPLQAVTDRYRANPDVQVLHLTSDADALRTTVGVFERACNGNTGYVWLGYGDGATVVGDVAAEVDADAATGTLPSRLHVELFDAPGDRYQTVDVVTHSIGR